MSFIAHVSVSNCDECPHKILKKVGPVRHPKCSELPEQPSTSYNGIRDNCPYNTSDKVLLSISDYVAYMKH